MIPAVGVQGCKGAKVCNRGAMHPGDGAEAKGAMHCTPNGVPVLLHPYASLAAHIPDATRLLAELRTPLHEPRTVEQLSEATGISAPRIRRALLWLSTTHGVRMANLRNNRVAWMLPS